MRIGLDISEKSISGALLEKDAIVNRVDKSIYSQKRDSNKTIMDKIIGMINELIDSQVNGIGISLPSTYDKNQRIVYDIQKIPYWKKIKIKQIIEKEFGLPVGVNNDINCFLLGEKFYGYNKDFKNILCIHLGQKIDVGVMVDNKLYTFNKLSFNNINCLSEAYYEYVRIYKNSYFRTLEELEFLCKNFPEECNNLPDKLWQELGASIGRIISVLLVNYNVDSIVLGGRLANSFCKYIGYIDEYLMKFFSPRVLLNLVITTSKHENPRPLGAVYCLKDLSINVIP